MPTFVATWSLNGGYKELYTYVRGDVVATWRLYTTEVIKNCIHPIQKKQLFLRNLLLVAHELMTSQFGTDLACQPKITLKVV